MEGLYNGCILEFFTSGNFHWWQVNFSAVMRHEPRATSCSSCILPVLAFPLLHQRPTAISTIHEYLILLYLASGLPGTAYVAAIPCFNAHAPISSPAWLTCGTATRWPRTRTTSSGSTITRTTTSTSRPSRARDRSACQSVFVFLFTSLVDVLCSCSLPSFRCTVACFLLVSFEARHSSFLWKSLKFSNLKF